MSEHQTPGQLISHLLGERGWSRRVLALVLDIDDSLLSKIIAGKRSVDAELALALGEVFGVEPIEFLQLQQAYDLAHARLVTKPDARRASRARIFGGLPVAEMIKRGWLAVEDAKNVRAVESAVAKFFAAESLDDITTPPHAAKKTDVGRDPSLTQQAWLHRVRTIAETMLVPPVFSERRTREAIAKLKQLTLAAEEARHAPRILAEAGIRFMLVEALPGAKIDGVCTWLHNAPVIALSLRHDRIDNFWFVLRHELEHALHGHGKEMPVVDVDLDLAGGELPPEEQVANAAAAEFCVPQSALMSFIARKDPYFAERDIIGFAKVNQIHPGLVAGQLQHKTKRYDRFRPHQVKIRTIVAPSAVVDGWGDVAPVGM